MWFALAGKRAKEQGKSGREEEFTTEITEGTEKRGRGGWAGGLGAGRRGEQEALAE